MTPETAMKQAGHTTEYYLERALNYLRGKGVVGADDVILTTHQAIVAAYVAACSRDFNTAVNGGHVEADLFGNVDDPWDGVIHYDQRA